MFFGAESYGINRPLPKFFVTGLALNFAAMASWAVVLELGYRFFRVGPGQVVPTVLMALALTVVAYIVDYHIVPKRFTPGFEHVLSVRGLALTYAGLALSLVAGGLGRVVG